MKRYKQLIKELPSKKVVFAFGRFQPPTNGHALLVNAVTKLASAQKADHVIYTSRTQDKKSNPLPANRKVYYLKRMFPHANFKAADESVRTFMEVATQLSKNYKHLVMIAGSDRVPEYKKLLDKYNGTTFNFETIEVVSAGERDPDSDSASGMSGTKMREAAKKGNFAAFKKGLPHGVTELDAKRLMNEIREGMGMDSIKESIQFERDTLRESYHAGTIFNIGDKVQDALGLYEIVDRGANYITVVNESGEISKKWLDAVSVVNIQEDIPSPTPADQLTYKGYTTKNFANSKDAISAFEQTIKRGLDPVAILNALKATDAYMAINDRHIAGEQLTDAERDEWNDAHKKARESLQKIGEFMHHMDYWHMHEHEFQDLNSNYPDAAEATEVSESLQGLKEMNITSTDRLKAARVIASALGVSDVDKSSNPSMLVNLGLRKIKQKAFSKNAMEIIKNMLSFADEVGIEYDKKLVPTSMAKVDEALVGTSMTNTDDDPILRKMKIQHHLGEEGEEPESEEDDNDEMDDDEIQKMIDGLQDDDFLHAYDDEELAIIDDETGEEVDDLKEETINEVLSRAERIRSKIRFARTKTKRERKLRIALKTRSNTAKVNQRARRMAVKVLKTRLARKPIDKLTVGEKERLERIIQKRKAAINRIAMRMVPKIRKIETSRLTHSSYTK